MEVFACSNTVGYRSRVALYSNALPLRPFVMLMHVDVHRSNHSLLSDCHAKAKLVVLLDMIKLSREDEVHANIDSLLQICSHLAICVYLTAQPALPQHVIIAKACRWLSGVPIPHEITCKSHLQSKIPYQLDNDTNTLQSDPHKGT